MAMELKMPQLGLTMEEGTVAKWLKAEGDAVKAGEPVVEITTDKLTNEVASEIDGVLLKIVAQEGSDVPVQGVLGLLGQAGESVGEVAPAAPVSVTPAVVEPVLSAPIAVTAPTPTTGRIRISRLAKKTAEKMGVDYTNLVGSGPMGRIIQKDILNAKVESVVHEIPKPVQIPEPVQVTTSSGVELMEGDTVIKLAGMRKVVAERMSKSHSEIPCVTQTMKINVTKLVAFRKELNSQREQKFSLNDFILKAVAKAMRTNPVLMVSIDGDTIIKRAHVNLGMAVALDEGLIVPVIKDADKMGIEDLSKKARDLAVRARENKLAMDEYKGSTITISNMGMYGIESFTPIINQPDAAILGVCEVQDELDLDEEGKLFKKQAMRISLTYDHRLVDGATAASFELTLKGLLENPMSILL